jgi:chaperone BCS1
MKDWINALRRAVWSNVSSSGLTDTPASISPAALLENLIPGYGYIHKLLLSLGFDVTVLVSLGAAPWVAIRFIRLIWGAIDSW